MIIPQQVHCQCYFIYTVISKPASSQQFVSLHSILDSKISFVEKILVFVSCCRKRVLFSLGEVGTRYQQVNGLLLNFKNESSRPDTIWLE